MTTTPPATTTPPVTTSTPADSFPLPKLAGLNFKDARTTVRDLKLGWTLKFEGVGNDPTVRDTTPAAGTLVAEGRQRHHLRQGRRAAGRRPGHRRQAVRPPRPT